jgi:hypothetical protein
LGTSPDDELDLDATDSGEAIGRNSHGDDTGDARTAESDEPVLAPTTGPYDIADAPDDGLARLDLGGIQVPVPDGVEIRLEVDQESGVVVAAVAVLGPNALQIGAFAAPKKNGIWADVVQEIAEGLRSAGGSADVVDGTWGRELRAKIPMEGPSGQRSVQSARFVGVDGPRWFLRGLFQGPAATDPGQARRLEDVLRGVVVVRGGEAMAPRDPIPLHMPREVAEAAADAEADPAAGPGAAENDGDGFSLDPFERGPEITETR